MIFKLHHLLSGTHIKKLMKISSAVILGVIKSNLSEGGLFDAHIYILTTHKPDSMAKKERKKERKKRSNPTFPWGFLRLWNQNAGNKRT